MLLEHDLASIRVVVPLGVGALELVEDALHVLVPLPLRRPLQLDVVPEELGAVLVRGLAPATCGTRVARPARTTMLRPGGDGSELDRGVRPVLGELLLVGKSPEGVAAAGWRDSSSGPPSDGWPAHGSLGGLTCGSLLPVVTARARCIPLPANFTCTHRVPAGLRS
jgi:hypothetical protein